MDRIRLSTVATTNSALQPSEIDFLRRELDARKREIATLISERDAYEAFLSPLRRNMVPPEILGEIFVLSLPDFRRFSSKHIRDICLVCKNWRDVAMGTPRLWCQINDWVDLDAQPSTLDKVQLWLSRSSSIPKSVSLYQPNRPSTGLTNFSGITTHLTESTSSTATFLSQGPILDELRLWCDTPRCFKQLASAASAEGPQTSSSWHALRSLELEVQEWEEPNYDILDDYMFWHLPTSLNRLSVSFPAFEDAMDMTDGLPDIPPPISHASLTSLTLLMAGWPVARWMLQSAEMCPGLQDLTLDFEGEGVNWEEFLPNGGTAITLPKLQTLRIQRLRQPPENTRLLRILKTPRIVNLDLGFALYDGRDHQQSVVRDPDIAYLKQDIAFFVAQSDCRNTLRTLRLQGLIITGKGILSHKSPV
ncbi:hypothetical protein NMY22_g16269 [Coprinellus aureogranulatus]|nr:hypothetical protein NMY22_g16269 [Coprinellus aureogranulatus]